VKADVNVVSVVGRNGSGIPGLSVGSTQPTLDGVAGLRTLGVYHADAGDWLQTGVTQGAAGNEWRPVQYFAAPRPADQFIPLGMRVWPDAVEFDAEGRVLRTEREAVAAVSDHLHFGDRLYAATTHDVIFRKLRIRRIPFGSPPDLAAPEAVDYYRKAIEFEPEFAGFHVKLAEALLANGRNAEAMLLVQGCQVSFPELRGVKRLLGDAHASRGDFVNAKIAYEEEIARNSRDFETQLRLAWLVATSPEPAVLDAVRGQKEVDQVREAISGWTKLVALDLAQAAVFAELGNFDGAKQSLAEAEEHGPTARERTLIESMKQQIDAGKPYRIAKPAQK
jgi:tetratricopeptide (TPR) repeat protein